MISSGYTFNEYEVTTADGYLLSMFRIGRRSSQNGTSTSANGSPVLIVHGFLSNAYDWLLLGPGDSLAYKLVDQGYDVWLGNCRGNKYSRKHVKYDPEEPPFWRFSFHEIGYYDLPAKIDFILNQTGYKSIYYIGHSQGTTSMFITASERPEYIKTIRLFIAFAPVAFTKSMPALMAELLATFYKPFEWFVYMFDYQEFLPGAHEVQHKVLRLFCDENMPFANLCRTFFRANVGYSVDSESFTAQQLFNSAPGGASTHQLLHFLQTKRSDKFCQYDYGFMTNYIKYGKSRPPDYNLKTTIPTALIYSNNDWLSTEQDVKRISAQLKNIKFRYKSHANHVDYLFGRRTNRILTPIITKLLRAN